MFSKKPVTNRWRYKNDLFFKIVLFYFLAVISTYDLTTILASNNRPASLGTRAARKLGERSGGGEDAKAGRVRVTDP